MRPSRVPSWTHQGLDRATLVHRAVALRDFRQRQHQVEHLPGFDGPVDDEIDQPRQALANRRRCRRSLTLCGSNSRLFGSIHEPSRTTVTAGPIAERRPSNS